MYWTVATKTMQAATAAGRAARIQPGIQLWRRGRGASVRRRVAPATERLPEHVDGGTAQRRARELREVAERKAMAYAQARSGGNADVVVVRGEAREGLTGDYLTVSVAGDLPRGTRFAAELTWAGRGLEARPSAAISV